MPLPNTGIKSQPDKWIRICPNCGKIITFKTYGSYRANKDSTSPCIDCKHALHAKKLTGRKRPEFSEEWRKNIGIAHKNSEVWVKSMNTPEYKEKHRQKMIRLIKENKTLIAFNPDACNVFDYINKQLTWNGFHGKNHGEKTVETYFLDYYEPTLNIAIEWDEKYHRKTKIKAQDTIRQEFIINKLNCEFYRVDDTTKLIKKVNSIGEDKTSQLQSLITEYYNNINKNNQTQEII